MGIFQNTRADKIENPIIDSDFWDENLDSLGKGKVQFDYNDRQFNFHILKYGIKNRIIRKRWEAGEPKYKNIATFGIYQFYDLNEKDRVSTVLNPWSPFNALLDLRLDKMETNTSANYYPYAGVTDISSRIKFLDDLGNYVQISYNRTHKIDDALNSIPDELSETIGLGIGYASRNFNLFTEFKYLNTTNELQSWRYLTELKPKGSCWSIIFGQEQILLKEGINSTLSFEFDFGGEEINN